MGDPLDVNALASQLLESAKSTLASSAKGFLESKRDAVKLLERASLKMAEAMAALAVETDPAKIADLKAVVSDYQSALKEEALSITVDAEAEAKSTFLVVLEDLGKIALGALPILLKAL